MFQLQVGITAILLAIACVAYSRILLKGLYKVVAYLVTDVIELEVVKLNTEGNIAFVVISYSVGMVAFQLETIVLFLTVDITEDTTVGGKRLFVIGGQKN